MRKTLALFAAILIVPAMAAAADHVVPRDAAHERLQAKAAQRDGDVRVLQDLLSTPDAKAIASRAGVDPQTARAAVAQLGDQELQELATRARALQADPAAGLERDIYDLLVIFLIVAIVIVVIQAVH
jgi:hypothetical protein